MYAEPGWRQLKLNIKKVGSTKDQRKSPKFTKFIWRLYMQEMCFRSPCLKFMWIKGNMNTLLGICTFLGCGLP